MICALANSLWLLGCLPELHRFRRGMRQVRQEQERVLGRILAQNAGTEFGCRYQFGSCRSVSDYQDRVPFQDYEEFRDDIERMAAGAPNVLTSENVTLLEPTSGSSGASKLIPYTTSLQREFQCGIRAWIADVFLHAPELLNGPAYWSVSPVGTQPERTSGGIPVGFDDDSAYIGGWQQSLSRAVMAVPSKVRFEQNVEAFRYATLRALIRARDLRLISVWNPTFFTVILDRLSEWAESLARDLHVEGLRCRARELHEAMRASTAQERFAQLWPKLGLISCWGDANAATPAAGLAGLFPRVWMQPKGLIATEGFISFPLHGHVGAALSIRSHFLEFLPVGSDGKAEGTLPHLAHQLERGSQYAVVLTSGGGLYRFQLGDVIEVTGHLHECPLVEFRERLGNVSDWFGEKLNEGYVSRVLGETFRQMGLAPTFAMLACEADPIAGYVLYVDGPAQDEQYLRAADEIDRCLCSNFHYDYARRLGQLQRIRVFHAPHAADSYLDAAVRSGQRSGNVKPRTLEKRGGWWRVFKGRFIRQGSAAPCH